MKMIAIICDANTDCLEIIKDDFLSEVEAKKYMIENNLNDENYFIEELEL